MRSVLGLLLLAVLATGFAVPAVRRAVRRFLQHSAQESPAVLPKLERSRWQLLAIVLWFASFTSLAEMAYLTYGKEITGYNTIGFDYMWRVPAGYVLIFAPIALLALRPSPRSLSAVVLLSSFVSALALLPIAVSGLYYWATATLAAGIALQVTRSWRAHAWMAARMVTTGPPFAAIVIGLAIVFVARPIAAERRSLAELPAAPAGPNIVLIVLDTVRAKSLSLYGYERATSPSLDRFAKKGLVFDRAYATAPWTLPSHASMFTGRFPHELLGPGLSPLDATYPTVAEVLGRHGYLTAGFVANTWFGGLEFGLGRGFQHYEDTEMSAFTLFDRTSFGHRFVKASGFMERFSTYDNLGRKSAEEINGAFLDWLARAEAGRPFFAFLNYCDTHAPYLPPEPFATKFTSKRPFGQLGSRHLDAWSADDVKGFRDAYDEALAYLDSQLDALFRAIDSTPRLRNTFVIVTSDHGEHFGEHGLLDHVNSVYLSLLHVPLVIVGPGIAAGQRTEEPVSLRDVAATILEAAGVTGTSLPGESLLSRAAATDTGTDPLLLSEVEKAMRGAYPEWYPAQRGRVKSLVSRDWQYIRNFGDGREELFDLRADPFGLTDRAGQEPARLNEYRLQLDALVKSSATLR
jgi:arylsulfatase A-like enzyme